jgi:hypothetical protein
MAIAVLQLFLVTIVVIIYCIVIVLSDDVYTLHTSILYMFITCVRHNEKNEAKLDENLISIVMVILRAVYTY